MPFYVILFRITSDASQLKGPRMWWILEWWVSSLLLNIYQNLNTKTYNLTSREIFDPKYFKIHFSLKKSQKDTKNPHKSIKKPSQKFRKHLSKSSKPSIDFNFLILLYLLKCHLFTMFFYIVPFIVQSFIKVLTRRKQIHL